jgi:uncharacterized protein YbaP (TraB family)
MYLQLTGTRTRLLGSMHLFPATSRRTPPWVADAFDWCDALVFESDPASILPFLKAPDASEVSKGVALQTLLHAGTWRELQAAWPDSGPVAPLADLRPWAAMIVAPTLFQQVVEGVEPRMLRSAAAQAKPVRYLETAQQVAASLESIPLQAIAAALDLLVADLAEPQRTLERMHAAWLHGDLQAVRQIADESPMFNLPGLRDAILDVRNRAWAARVKERLSDPERTLIVVGALHLSGEGSLIECLGLPVEPVTDVQN